MRLAVVCYSQTKAKGSVKYLPHNSRRRCPAFLILHSLLFSSQTSPRCQVPSFHLLPSSIHPSYSRRLLLTPPPPPLAGEGGCLREVRIMPLIWVYARTLVPYPSPARRDTADLPECCVNTGGLATRAPHHKRRRRRTPEQDRLHRRGNESRAGRRERSYYLCATRVVGSDKWA